MSKKTKSTAGAGLPNALIRVIFTNTGEITVENTALPQPKPPGPFAGETTLGASPLAFSVSVDSGSTATMVQTFECWMIIYDSQTLQALGGENPFALDPFPVSHPGAPAMNIKVMERVSFTAKKVPGKKVVKITIIKPGVTTEIILDRARTAYSIALFMAPGQQGALSFPKWPGSKSGKTFRRA